MRCYQLGLYEKSMPGSLTLAEKLAETRAAGFDYLELSIDESGEKLARLNWTDGEIEALRLEQERQGIPIKSICLSGQRKYPLGHPDGAMQEKSLQILQKTVGLAAKLGVRIIQLAGYDVYYEESTPETQATFAKNLALGVEMAAREGVLLAFETMETAFMDTTLKAMRWVNKLNSLYLQLYPDIGNLTNAALLYGGDVRQDLQLGRGHLAAMHLKETVPGVFREVPYGTGHVDFFAAAQNALELGVRLFVGEFWDAGEVTWRDTLQKNNRFLRTALDAAATGNLHSDCAILEL